MRTGEKIQWFALGDVFSSDKDIRDGYTGYSQGLGCIGFGCRSTNRPAWLRLFRPRQELRESKWAQY